MVQRGYRNHVQIYIVAQMTTLQTVQLSTGPRILAANRSYMLYGL